MLNDSITGTEVMRIDSSGNVGIGHTTPQFGLTLPQGTGASNKIGWEDAGNTKRASITCSSSTDALQFHTGSSDAERMRIDSSGNVGIGVTPENWQSTRNTLQIGAGAIYANGTGAGSDVEITQNAYYDGSWKYINTDEVSRHYQSSGIHTFDVATSGSADAAITWKTPFKVGHQSVTGGDWCTVLNQSIEPNGTVYYMNFTLDGSSKGSILGNSSSVSYNTSSDYRLKENVDYTWDATTRLKQLKPARFNFIVDDTNTLVDGFIAHEVSSVVPEAITGEKDAMKDEEYEVTPAVEEVRDEEGNITTEAVEAVMGTRSVPDYQGIDQSKLVPLLVKTIQELEARITALES